MANFENSDELILKDVRLDYFDAWTPGEPQSAADKANPKKWKYKAKVIFAPDSPAATAAKNGLMQAATKLWGANAANMLRSLPTNSKAVRKGDDYLAADGSVRPNYAGMLFASASNVQKPAVVGQAKHNGKFVHISADGLAYVDGAIVAPAYKITAPYRGCYVNLKLQFIAGKADPARDMPNQVYAKLIAIQFVRDGEAFGNAPTSAEGFDDEAVESNGAGIDGSEDGLF